MQFESKIERTLWTRVVVALVPDILIGIGVAAVTSTGFVGLIVTVVSLQVLYLAIWVKNRSWDWFIFWATGDRKKVRLRMIDFLRENRFPEPNSYLRDADVYFQGIADSPDFPCELRVKAATELAASQCMAQLGHKLRLAMAWEDAIEEYKRVFLPQVQ